MTTLACEITPSPYYFERSGSVKRRDLLVQLRRKATLQSAQMATPMAVAEEVEEVAEDADEDEAAEVDSLKQHKTTTSMQACSSRVLLQVTSSCVRPGVRCCAVQCRSYAVNKKAGKNSQTLPRHAKIEADAGDVQVLQTKGKGKGKGKMDAVVGNELDVLPGESFDMAPLEREMLQSIDKLQVALNSVVSRVGCVSAGAFSLCIFTEGAGTNACSCSYTGSHPRRDQWAMVTHERPCVCISQRWDDYAAECLRPLRAHFASQCTALCSRILTVHSCGRESAICCSGQSEPTESRCIYASNQHIQVSKKLDLVPAVSLRKIVRPDVALREELSRQASTLCENARASIRSVRHEGQKRIKKDADSKVITKDDARAETKQVRLCEAASRDAR